MQICVEKSHFQFSPILKDIHRQRVWILSKSIEVNNKFWDFFSQFEYGDYEFDIIYLLFCVYVWEFWRKIQKIGYEIWEPILSGNRVREFW